MQLLQLPNELLLLIFQHLNGKEKLDARLVCKYFNILSFASLTPKKRGKLIWDCPESIFDIISNMHLKINTYPNIKYPLRNERIKKLGLKEYIYESIIISPIDIRGGCVDGHNIYFVSDNHLHLYNENEVLSFKSFYNDLVTCALWNNNLYLATKTHILYNNRIIWIVPSKDELYKCTTKHLGLYEPVKNEYELEIHDKNDTIPEICDIKIENGHLTIFIKLDKMVQSFTDHFTRNFHASYWRITINLIDNIIIENCYFESNYKYTQFSQGLYSIGNKIFDGSKCIAHTYRNWKKSYDDKHMVRILGTIDNKIIVNDCKEIFYLFHSRSVC